MRLRFIYILSIFYFTLNAQESKVIITEDTTLKAEEYDKLFNLLSENKTRINSLFKFNAVEWGQLSPSFIYEQRLYKSLTIEPVLRLDGFGVDQQNGLKYMLTPELRFKLYHNFKYRERNGKNTNGFSGNYFLASMLFPFGDTPDMLEAQLNRQYFYTYNLESLRENEIHALGMLHFGYGLQRRFLNMGYLDCAFGINMQVFNSGIAKQKPIPFIKIGIGFGITPKKAKELTE